MFEVAELKHTLKKKNYEEQVPNIRTRLLELQYELFKADFPLIITISGVDGAGKSDMLNILNEWLDPRYIQNHAFAAPSDEESERPAFWRYWMALPPKSYTAIFSRSWYSAPIAERINKVISNARLDAELIHINKFEKELVDDGALILKYWLHLSKKQQLKKLEKLESNPDTRWRVSTMDRKHIQLYDRFIRVTERVLRETSTPEAPWMIINAWDEHYRRLTLAQHLIERLSYHLESRRAAKAASAAVSATTRVHSLTDSISLLQSLDMNHKLPKKDYQKEIDHYQEEIARLSRLARDKKISTTVVFEGWDAAGKGGVIRRIIRAMDPRHYRVIPIAAPTDEEKAHHYLWRFWRHLPRDGRFTIYDRSWYGRILVERVENFAKPDEWMRAYSEINDFEEELTDHGIIVLKFWLHITKEEQLKRFKERETISYKQHKITEEDYRNREKWEDYEQAVNEMVTRTSTEFAPWHLVEANDKAYARVKVLRLICEKLGERVR